uniref:Endoglin n=1 Tax=Salvator merianae TaxID=96440 RepID=A0A8D0BUL8_SALMN
MLARIMETAWCLVVVFTAARVVPAGANPVNSSSCLLKPVLSDQDVKVSYITSQVTSCCIGHGPTDPDLEVHVLSLWLSNSAGVIREIKFNVNTSAANRNRKIVFVVNTNAFSLFTVVPTDQHHVTFITSPNKPVVAGNNISTNIANLPSSNGELLKWAETKYGGVSSFTVLEDPEWICFQVGKELNTSKDCIPENNFEAKDFLEFQTVSHGTESCLGSSDHPGKEAHILWLQQSPPRTGTEAIDLNIKVTCRDGNPVNQYPTLLVLKGYEGLFWNISHMANTLKLLVSGKYFIKNFPLSPINGTVLPDSKDGLISKATKHDFPFIASYTEIPSARSITLELHRTCGQATEVTTAAQSKASSLSTLAQQLMKLSPPWRCTENTIEIAVIKNHLQALKNPVTEITLQDPNCKAIDNTTHFVLKSIPENCSTHLEGGIHAKNQLVLTMPALPDKIRVPFECDLPEKLFLHLYHTPDFRSSAITTIVEVNKPTYVQVSVRTANQSIPSQLQDCFLQIPGQPLPQELIRDGNPLSYSAVILDSPSPKSWRFSFTYRADAGQEPTPATLVCKHSNHESSLEVMLKPTNPPSHSLGIGTVLGITFGAFLIGVMLTAALWYIYSHTRPTGKMQPVSENPPVSESSSSNHSIGSTQSTPCSTSSMA